MENVRVPSQIARRQLAQVPVSLPLLIALKRLRVRYLEDLCRVLPREWDALRQSNLRLFAELRKLLRRVAAGKVTPPPPLPSKIGARAFHVPASVRKLPIAGFPMTSPLRNLCAANGLQLLGDLEGMGLTDFLALGNCGPTRLQEMRDLLRAVRQGQRPVEPIRVDPASPTPGNCFFVPPEARELKVRGIPMSRRLADVLRAKSVKHFGALHGLPVRELWLARNCGQKTIEELLQLLQRAAKGEFQPPSRGFSRSDVGDLLRSLDDILAKAPPLDRDILLARLGTTEEPHAATGPIADRFNLSGWRIRFSEQKILCDIRRKSGPRVAAQLRGLGRILRRLRHPLTPALLTKWLNECRTARPFPLVFYARLLDRLAAASAKKGSRQRPA